MSETSENVSINTATFKNEPSIQVNEESLKTCEEIGLISVTDLIKNIALIKEFATRKECNEQIYLCADHIEQELHKLIYNPNSFKLENDW